MVDKPAAEVSQLLDEAVARSLIRATPDKLDNFQFSNSLLREALYSRLSSIKRSLLHERTAKTIECVNRAAETESPELLAHHYFHANQHARPEATLRFVILAAEKAARTLAFDEALDWCLQALLLAEAAGKLDSQCDILISLGQNQALSGHWQASRQTYLRAAELARRIGSPEKLVLAGIGVKGLISASLPPNQSAIQILSEALQQPTLLPLEVRIQAIAGLSTEQHFVPRRYRHEGLAEEADRLSVAYPSAKVRSVALEAQIFNNWRASRIELFNQFSQELLELGRKGSLPDISCKAHIFLFLGKTQINQPDAPLELDAAEELAIDLRHPKLLWQIKLARASSSLAKGNLQEYNKLIDTATQLGGRCHDPTANQHLAINLLALARLTGALDRFKSIAPSIDSAALDSALARVGTTYQHYITGQVALAHRTFGSVVEMVRTDPDADAFSLWTNCVLAEFAYLLADRATAEQLLPLLLPFRQQVAIAGWGTALEGAVSHFVGILQLTTERKQEAIASLELAVETNNSCGWPLLTARSKTALSIALAGQSDSPVMARARLLATQSSTVYTALGIDPSKHPFILPPADPNSRNIMEELLAIQDFDHNDAKEIATEPGRATICFEGDYTSLQFGTKLIRLKNTKSVQQLCVLLQHSGQHIPALILARVSSNGAGIAVDSISQAGSESSPAQDLDPQAIAAYARRAADLRALLSTPSSDPAEILEFREELEWLESTLASCTNIRGTSRQSGSDHERARISVRNNITNILKKVTNIDREFGRHLDSAIGTGHLCIYSPIKPVVWTSQATI